MASKNPTKNQIVDAVTERFFGGLQWTYYYGGKGGKTFTRIYQKKTVEGPGIDCSNLVHHTMLAAGYKVEYLTSKTMKDIVNGSISKYYSNVDDINKMKTGDLIVFNGHVAIVTSYDPVTGIGTLDNAQSKESGLKEDVIFTTNPTMKGKKVFNPMTDKIDKVSYYGTDKKPVVGILRVNESAYDPIGASEKLDQINQNVDKGLIRKELVPYFSDISEQSSYLYDPISIVTANCSDTDNSNLISNLRYDLLEMDEYGNENGTVSILVDDNGVFVQTELGTYERRSDDSVKICLTATIGEDGNTATGEFEIINGQITSGTFQVTDTNNNLVEKTEAMVDGDNKITTANNYLDDFITKDTVNMQTGLATQEIWGYQDDGMRFYSRVCSDGSETEIVTNIDGNGNVTGYVETNNIYDSNYNVTSSIETNKDENGTSIITETWQGTYDAFGNLTSCSETYTDSNEEVTYTDIWTGTYDSSSKLVSSNEIETDVDGEVTTIDELYNSSGEVHSYDETTQDAEGAAIGTISFNISDGRLTIESNYTLLEIGELMRTLSIPEITALEAISDGETILSADIVDGLLTLSTDYALEDITDLIWLFGPEDTDSVEFCNLDGREQLSVSIDNGHLIVNTTLPQSEVLSSLGPVISPLENIFSDQTTEDPTAGLTINGDDLFTACSGNIVLAYRIHFINATTVAPRDPLILDLDNDGLETSGITDGAYFDHDGNGFAEKTGWVGSDDGLLVMDRNGNGTIDNGSELFGDQTILINGQKATDGFQALSELDTYSDNIIDINDTAFLNLRIWQDIDSDGYSASDELFTLSEMGIQSINLTHTSTSILDPQGNTLIQQGLFTKTDGTTASLGGFNLQRDVTYTIATDWLDIPDDIAALPDLQGYGNTYDLHQALARDTTGILKSLIEQFITAEDPSARASLMEQILFKWTGSDTINPDSRGPNFDSRKLAVLEKLMGQSFTGANGSNPNTLAAPLLAQAYEGIFEMYYAQLMAQTHLKYVYDAITYSWDEATQSLKGDLNAAILALQNSLSANPSSESEPISLSFNNVGVVENDTTGDDVIYAGTGSDVAWGEGGDILSGDAQVSGLAVNFHSDDYIDGKAGKDTIYRNDGSDTMYGTGNVYSDLFEH